MLKSVNVKFRTLLRDEIWREIARIEQVVSGAILTEKRRIF
jgi:hypothetical protein